MFIQNFVNHMTSKITTDTIEGNKIFFGKKEKILTSLEFVVGICRLNLDVGIRFYFDLLRRITKISKKKV